MNNKIILILVIVIGLIFLIPTLSASFPITETHGEQLSTYTTDCGPWGMKIFTKCTLNITEFGLMTPLTGGPYQYPAISCGVMENGSSPYVVLQSGTINEAHTKCILDAPYTVENETYVILYTVGTPYDPEMPQCWDHWDGYDASYPYIGTNIDWITGCYGGWGSYDTCQDFPTQVEEFTNVTTRCLDTTAPYFMNLTDQILPHYGLNTTLGVYEQIGSLMGSYNAMAIDSTGVIHAINKHDNNAYVYGNSGAFTQVDLGLGYRTQGAIAVDSNDKEHIIWQDTYCNNTDESWSCTDTIGSGSANSIAIDKNNKVHSLSTDGTDLIYCHNIDEIWNCSAIDGGVQNSIAISNLDNLLHIIYLNDTGIAYCNSSVGDGVNWNCQKISGLDGHINDGPLSLSIDTNNKLHFSFVYNASNTLGYCNNVYGSWECNTNVDKYSGSGTQFPSLALDKNNNAHILYFNSLIYGARYCNNINFNWECMDLPNDPIIRGGESAPYGRSIAIKEGRLVDSNKFSDYIHGVYYSRDEEWSYEYFYYWNKNISEYNKITKSLNYYVAVSDYLESEISSFWINWTDTFNINSTTGLLTNTSALEPNRKYWVNVSVNDTWGNINSSIFYVINRAEELSEENETTPPTIVIISPLNANYSDAYTNPLINLSILYSVTDSSNISNCWYSKDNSVNISLPNCINTTLTFGIGSHTITIWANDTLGNENHASVSFNYSTIPATPSTGGDISGYITTNEIFYTTTVTHEPQWTFDTINNIIVTITNYSNGPIDIDDVKIALTTPGVTYTFTNVKNKIGEYIVRFSIPSQNITSVDFKITTTSGSKVITQDISIPISIATSPYSGITAAVTRVGNFVDDYIGEILVFILFVSVLLVIIAFAKKK